MAKITLNISDADLERILLSIGWNRESPPKPYFVNWLSTVLKKAVLTNEMQIAQREAANSIQINFKSPEILEEP